MIDVETRKVQYVPDSNVAILNGPDTVAPN